jgi:hypothetical protein
MYEIPKLNRVGDVQKVILGFIAFGGDLDMTWVGDNQQYADDGDDLRNSPLER